MATLGLRPAVVTGVLELLLRRGCAIRTVEVIHTAASEGPARSVRTEAGTAAPLETLRALFPDGTRYRHPAGERNCRFRSVPIEVDGRTVAELRTEHEAKAAFRTMYDVVREAKAEGARVHLSIAGGRKVMSAYGIAAAQLLFDSEDRAWHLLSTPAFEAGGGLHPGQSDAQLVPVPILSVGLALVGPLAALLEAHDPESVIDEQRLALRHRRRALCQDFLDHMLTAGERRTVGVFLREVVGRRRNVKSAELGQLLYLSDTTVRRHLSDVYAKMQEHFDLHRTRPDDRLLVAVFAEHYRQLDWGDALLDEPPDTRVHP